MAESSPGAAPANDLRDLRACVALWQGREGNPDSADCGWYFRLARRGLAIGEPLFAYEVCAEAVERWQDRGDLQTVLAQALARSGATESALEVANEIYKGGRRDGELLGLLGRIHKDLWQQRRDPAELAESIRFYEEGFKLESRNYFPGINAATLALCAGRKRHARELARAVLDICFEELRQTAPDTGDWLKSLFPPLAAGAAGVRPADAGISRNYWLLATIGEAALVFDAPPLAQAAYVAARASHEAGFGSVATSRRNAALILAGRKDGAELLALLFPKPRIAIFSGHVVDGAERASPRFPLNAVPCVDAAIRAWLDESATSIGYASAASGGDMLFHAALAARRAERHVVLPHSREVFSEHSVAPAGPDWVKRYEELLDAATSVTAVADEVSDDESYRYANRMLLGMARARARRIEGEVVGLTLWDGRQGKAGGTGSAVTGWLAAGVPVVAIDPLTGKTRTLRSERGRRLETRPKPQYGRRETVAMLFADAVGFSKLTEKQLPLFIRHFLRPVGRLAGSGRSRRGRKGRPITVNTWGDGLYMTFLSATDAGAFALALCDLGAHTDWVKLGLPPHMNVRIGLHAGPAIRMIDPVTGQLNFMGSNVSRAARIEPVTPPGQVYCSEPFAALAEAESAKTIVCEYVGTTAMAKKYGSFPTYRVRATRAR